MFVNVSVLCLVHGEESDERCKISVLSESGDLRKNSDSKQSDVDESSIMIHLARKTSGKGRTIIELTNLPANKKWCQKLAKELKKKLAVGGAYKNDFIEVHGEKIDEVKSFLENKKIKHKQIGG